MIKKNLAAIALTGLIAGACTGVSVEKAKIKTTADSVSYIVGTDYGSGISQQMEQFPGGMNSDEFLNAFITSFKGEESKITVEDARTYIMTYVQEAQTAVAAAEADSTMEEAVLPQKDSVSYIVGADYGEGIAKQMEEFPGGMNNIAFLEAFVTAFNGDSSRISVEDSRTFIMNYVQEAQKEEAAANADKFKAAAQEGIAFLEANGTKDGVITTASGLQYSVITAGEGAKPTATSKVSVHYHGTLIDGTVFDSSVDRGQPASFGVNQVIKGWTEALQLMSTGDKWTLYIPSELAYGSNPPGGTIPPDAVLIFEVELLEVLN